MQPFRRTKEVFGGGGGYLTEKGGTETEECGYTRNTFQEPGTFEWKALG